MVGIIEVIVYYAVSRNNVVRRAIEVDANTVVLKVISVKVAEIARVKVDAVLESLDDCIS